MGYIYKITCAPTGLSYIGKTTKSPTERFNKHWKDRITSLRHEYKTNGSYRGGCRKLYETMNSYNKDDFVVEVIKECDDNLLDEEESIAIESLGTLYPDGYNLTTGGKFCTLSQHSKDTISVRTSECIKDDNIDKFRKHDKVLGLPKRVVWISNETKRGFAINKHPKCSFKSFTIKNYGSTDAAKNAVLEYLQTLNNP